MDQQHDMPAGGFSSWLRGMRDSLVKEKGVDVPCGDCSACCRSSYFIHIKPEEGQTLARINKKLLFPAPGLPRGSVVLGYYEGGRCPMLIDAGCSIYDHRPQTCRDYDCRVFAAAGIAPGEDDKGLLTRRVKRWRFSCPTRLDQERHSAVKTAAKFLRERADCFPEGMRPKNEVQLAVLAIKVYDVFLRGRYAPGRTGHVLNDSGAARAVIKAYEKFEARRTKYLKKDE
jgi:Fe-S-cluster containining protein